MIHQLYKKQVEAWKERFVHGEIPEKGYVGWVDEGNAKDLLSSRHKDTIELLEAIIKEVENKEREGGELTPYLEVVKTKNMDKMFDYAYEKARKDFLTTLQAEKELIENEK